MKYHWNHKAFGRNVGDVETAEEIKNACPVALETLVASGMVTDSTKRAATTKPKKEKDDDKDGDTTIG